MQCHLATNEVKTNTNTINIRIIFFSISDSCSLRRKQWQINLCKYLHNTNKENANNDYGLGCNNASVCCANCNRMNKAQRSLKRIRTTLKPQA